MKTDEYGYPTFLLTTKHGDLMVIVHDKTVEKDGRDQDIRPIHLRGSLRINGVDVRVDGSFRVYNTQDNELHAYSQYGISRAGNPFGADVTTAARTTVNGYAVKAYKEVTEEMWVQARRAVLRGNGARLRSKAAELRAEADKLEKQADEEDKKIPAK